MAEKEETVVKAVVDPFLMLIAEFTEAEAEAEAAEVVMVQTVELVAPLQNIKEAEVVEEVDMVAPGHPVQLHIIVEIHHFQCLVEAEVMELVPTVEEHHQDMLLQLAHFPVLLLCNT